VGPSKSVARGSADILLLDRLAQADLLKLFAKIHFSVWNSAISVAWGFPDYDNFGIGAVFGTLDPLSGIPLARVLSN